MRRSLKILVIVLGVVVPATIAGAGFIFAAEPPGASTTPANTTVCGQYGNCPLLSGTNGSTAGVPSGGCTMLRYSNPN